MITTEELISARDEYKKKSNYYNNISFPILAEMFKEMSEMCDKMIAVITEYNKFKESENENKEEQ